jgi:hypothetical protein
MAAELERLRTQVHAERIMEGSRSETSNESVYRSEQGGSGVRRSKEEEKRREKERKEKEKKDMIKPGRRGGGYGKQAVPKEILKDNAELGKGKGWTPGDALVSGLFRRGR